MFSYHKLLVALLIFLSSHASYLHASDTKSGPEPETEFDFLEVVVGGVHEREIQALKDELAQVKQELARVQAELLIVKQKLADETAARNRLESRAPEDDSLISPFGLGFYGVF